MIFNVGNRFNITGLIFVILYFLADSTDHAGDGSQIAFAVLMPDCFKDLLLCKQFARMLCHQTQNTVSHLLKGMMREVCDAGGAIFFSTHVLEVAEKLCDKVAIIKGGKLIRSGTMETVKGDDSLEDVFLELEGESC